MKNSILFMILVLVSVNLACQSKKSVEPFFFIQMTDSQMGMFSNNADFLAETALFEKAIAHANRLKPAFVVITGDLINQFGNEAQVQEFLRISRQLDPGIPLYLVAGNHDVENAPTPESLNWYRERFGKDYYSFKLNDCYYIVLNSVIIHTPTHVAAETDLQWAWLQAEIRDAVAARPHHIFIVQHHPYFLENPAEDDAYFNIPQSVRQEYLNLFQQAGVRAILTGHHHRNGLAQAGNMEMIITSAVGKPLGDAPSGFRIFMVSAEQVRHRYFGLDEVPARETVFEMLPGKIDEPEQ
jgi:3',5'-cyclic AMP phosphodiesterase CpdA